MQPFLLCLSLLLCNSVLAFDSPQALQDAFMKAMRTNDAAGMAARYTDVARKINGQWLYIADHASVPLAPPPDD